MKLTKELIEENLKLVDEAKEEFMLLSDEQIASIVLFLYLELIRRRLEKEKNRKVK